MSRRPAPVARPSTASVRGRVPGALAAALLVAISAAGAVIAAPAAQAHNVVVDTSPAEDGSVRTAPEEVELVFNEKVLGLGTSVQVVGPDGDAHAGKASIVDQTVTQPLRTDVPAGTYTVTWRVTSADGHPIDGEFSYDVERGTTTANADASDAADASSGDETTSASTAQANSGSSPMPIILGSAALVLLLGAGAFANRRRRRTAS
jgi:methionine-rich copper-binding protein CopC